MADEVKLGVAVIPVRVSLDELDQGLSQARVKIESVLGGAWQKAGSGASGLQESVAGATASVSGLASETVGATSAAADMGRELENAATGKGAPAVKGLVDQVGGLTRGLQQVMQIAGSAV
ncbi:MAG: hypothetical protein GX595_19245, partial [Lentisphaerae bacterium]|nr:hypothetical protein [Lentisphaerota bacterium]